MSERDEDRGSSPRVGAFFASMSVDGAVSYLLKESCSMCNASAAFAT